MTETNANGDAVGATGGPVGGDAAEPTGADAVVPELDGSDVADATSQAQGAEAGRQGTQQTQQTKQTKTSKPLPTEIDTARQEAAMLRAQINDLQYAQEQERLNREMAIEASMQNADPETKAAYYANKLAEERQRVQDERRRVQALQGQRNTAIQLVAEFGLDPNDKAVATVIEANLGKQGGMATIMREAGKLVKSQIDALKREVGKAEQRGKLAGVAATGVTRTLNGGTSGGGIDAEIKAERERIARTGDRDWSRLRALQNKKLGGG